MPTTVNAYAVADAKAPVAPFKIQRRDLRPNDVEIDIEYCGICHSDLHKARGDWGAVNWPIVVGHEIIGTVSKVGSEVSKHKPGDKVGVGCLVDSCLKCRACDRHLEQYCKNIATFTYGSTDPDFGGSTQGGYSEKIVVNEPFVLKVPENIYGAAAAPLLCAGITMWSPLAHWKVEKGQKVGIVGLGGLGHMGVKFAKALGAETWVITTSKAKADAARELGVDGVLFSNDKDEMAKHSSTFDFLINTIPVRHDVQPYLQLLDIDGVQVLVGVLEPMEEFSGRELARNRRTLAGSIIGGIKETQEMLDFCGKHNVVSDIELTDYAHVNEAWERVKKNDVKYRFVLDNKTLSK